MSSKNVCLHEKTQVYSQFKKIVNKFFTVVSLPRGWIQEIKCMYLVHLTHGLFLTLNTEILFYYRPYITIFTR